MGECAEKKPERETEREQGSEWIYILMLKGLHLSSWYDRRVIECVHMYARAGAPDHN